MKIEWSIKKERGNLRPILTYSFSVDKFEKALALPPVIIKSTIPEPLESWREYCYPNVDERMTTPKYKDFYRLEIISHKGNLWSQKLRLPWRANNAYPEIEESFILLRKAFEDELERANASLPINTNAHLQITDSANKNIAPTILAEKLLNFARREDSLI